jgi:hypothetical protein
VLQQRSGQPVEAGPVLAQQGYHFLVSRGDDPRTSSSTSFCVSGEISGAGRGLSRLVAAL